MVNYNLKSAQAATTLTAFLWLLDHGFHLLQWHHGSLVVPNGTMTLTELAIFASVRCIVSVNTAVQLYRGESLQP